MIAPLFLSKGNFYKNIHKELDNLYYTIIWLLASVGLIFADQWIKNWVVATLSNTPTVPLIQDVLHLTFCKNYGAAFSILQGKTVFLVVITSTVLLALLFLLLTRRIQSKMLISSISLIIAGGVGNLIDRVMREGNYVVDYIDFRLINFPVFNLADICICTGTGLFLLYMLFIEPKERQTNHE